MELILEKDVMLDKRILQELNLKINLIKDYLQLKF